jgi:hypothetical protein
MDIVIDPTIRVREVNTFVTSRYSEAMRAGEIFPPITIDKKNRLVRGHHRVYSYKAVFEPDHEIECEISKNTNDADLIMEALEDNCRHGEPLTTWEKKVAVLRLVNDYKKDIEAVSKIIGVTIGRIEEWNEMIVVVTPEPGDMNKKSHVASIKKGAEQMKGKTVTRKEYETHETHDLGVPPRFHMNKLISLFDRGGAWVPYDDKTFSSAVELRDLLNKYINNKKEVK